MWGRETRREVNRKRFRLNLNGYAVHYLSTPHREERVSQVWTVRKGSLWMDLQMHALRNPAALAVGATARCSHPLEHSVLVRH